jgi:hypothetical protein
VLTRALQKKPDKRWGSAQELGKAFRDVAREVGQTAAARRPGRALGTGGPRSDRVGHLDLRAASGKTDDQVADASLPGGGPPPAVTARPRSRIRAAVVATALVAVSGVGGYGGYYLFRVLGGDQPTTSTPGAAARTVDDGAGEGPAAPEPPASSPAGDPAESAPVAPVPELVVTSTPPGAAVSLDGEDTGETTPVSRPLEEPYPQTVALTLAGYRPVSQEMPAVESDVVEVSFGELTRTLGRIGLSDDYPFEVWIGDRQRRELGDSSEITGWPTGSVTVRIRNPEYFLDQSFTLEVVEDGRVELDAPALGSLSVFTNPGNCEIFIDSQSIGFQPINERPVASGTYTVSRHCPDEQENREQDVNMVSNEDYEVRFLRVQR